MSAILDNELPVDQPEQKTIGKHRAENELTPVMQEAKDKVLAIFPDAISRFYWNLESDGFEVVSDGTVIGRHKFFGYEWIMAAEAMS